MTTCPNTGSLVPTGHRTSELNPVTMLAQRAFRCPVCKAVHTWGAEGAIIEQPHPYRPAA